VTDLTRRRLGGAALALASGWLPLRGPRAAERPLLLGVHPYVSPAEVRQRFTPLADYLGRSQGRPCVVRVGASYLEHERVVGQDGVDLAYIGPVAYLRVVDHYGPRPILARVETNGRPQMSGVIFVRQDSPLQRVQDLKSRRFAFGDTESTMSAVLARYVLLQGGVRLVDLGAYAFLGAHDNVALGVLSGDFDAGAMRADVFDEFGPERGLRILAHLPPVSEHPFVARSDLAPAELAALRSALLQVHAAPDGGGILQSLGHEVTGLVPGSDADYESLRRIVRALAKAA
jgi:phosphonate transport system substrate-binding protein